MTWDEIRIIFDDPKTTAQTLHQLANANPQAHPYIAAHPRAYPELLHWLGGIGNPETNAVLAARERGLIGVDALVAAGVISTVSPVAEPSRAGRNVFLLVAIFIVASLAIVLLFIGFHLKGNLSFLNSDNNSADPKSAASTQTPQTEQQPEPEKPPVQESVEKDQEKKEPRLPVPAGAIEVNQFHSPTGNLVCQLQGEEAICAVLENNYQSAGLPNCGNSQFAVTTGPDEGITGLICDAGVEKNDTVLDYGKVATNGKVVCYSEQSGMRCFNLMTGNGFEVARENWSVVRGEKP